MSGTPNIREEFTVQRLTRALSKPEYRSLFVNLWQDQAVENDSKAAARQAYIASHGNVPKGDLKVQQTKTIEAFAAGSVKYAFGPKAAPKVIDPVVVVEPGSTGSVTLYRVFDGNVAKTIGGWWFSKNVLRAVASQKQFEGLTGDNRANQICKRLCQLMFVHPTWNEAHFLAKMDLGDGRKTVALAARGDWQALNSVEGFKGVEELSALGMKEGPGTVQYFIPLPNPMYITKIPNAMAHWPLGEDLRK